MERLQSEQRAVQPAEPVCFQNLGWLRVSCRHSNVTQEPGRTSTQNLFAPLYQEIVSRLAGKESIFPPGKAFPPGIKVDPFAIQLCRAIRLRCATHRRPTIWTGGVLEAMIEKLTALVSYPYYLIRFRNTNSKLLQSL